MAIPPVHTDWQDTVTITKLQKHLRFNLIPTEIQNRFFIEREKTILKFNEKHKQLPIARAILSRRQIGDIAIIFPKLYYSDTVKIK